MRQKIEFNDGIDKVIKELVNQSKTLDEITEYLNNTLNFKCSRAVLNNRINTLGLDINNNRKRKTTIDEDEILSFIIDGLDYDTIAEKMHVNPNTLKDLIIRHDLVSKAEQKKIRLTTWIGNDIIDLRFINDDTIKGLSKYLNCELEINSIVNILDRKFKFDFYSKKYNIAFLCCKTLDLPTRLHAITGQEQWDWKMKIRESDPTIKIIPYFYRKGDEKQIANQFNKIMSDPYNVDEVEEKKKSHDIFYYSLDDSNKDKLYTSAFTKVTTKWDEEKKAYEKKLSSDIKFQRLECFKFENVPYDRDGFRLIDPDTLIININPTTGDKLSQQQKDKLLQLVKIFFNDEYEKYLYSSTHKPKDEEDSDGWNYHCGRKVYHILKDNYPQYLKF